MLLLYGWRRKSRAKDCRSLRELDGEGNGTPLQYSCLEKSHGWRWEKDNCKVTRIFPFRPWGTGGEGESGGGAAGSFPLVVARVHTQGPPRPLFGASQKLLCAEAEPRTHALSLHFPCRHLSSRPNPAGLGSCFKGLIPKSPEAAFQGRGSLVPFVPSSPA